MAETRVKGFKRIKHVLPTQNADGSDSVGLETTEERIL